MIPLSVPNIGGKEWTYVKRCLDTGWVSSAGKFIGDFEKAICRYAGAGHAVASSSGTSALFLALKLSGILPGDEVIVPTLSFIASANVVKYTGAEPVFMDCDDFMNISADKLEDFCRNECRLTSNGLKNKRSGRMIKAVMPVHIFGNPCDMESILKIASKYNIKVIEDATESLGSRYTCGKLKGKFTGTVGEFGAYSFNGNKIITTGGGGMLIARSKKDAVEAKYLSSQAKDDSIKHIHGKIGYNFRLSNIQAAMGIAQLEKIEDFISIKKRNYLKYSAMLKDIPGVSLLGVPSGTRPNYWFYSIMIDVKKFGMEKEDLMRRLEQRGIETRPIWRLNHIQLPYRKNQAYRIEKAAWFWKRVLNIPCSSNLTENEVRKVAEAIKRMKRRTWKR